MKKEELGYRWQTFQERCFTHCVAPRECNPASHGNIMEIQIRTDAHGKIFMRHVNSNAWVYEMSDRREISEADLDDIIPDDN